MSGYASALGGATAGGGGAAISAGGASQNTGTIIFSNASGVSFGLNAGTLTASVKTDYQTSGAYLTTAMASNRGSDFVAATAAFAGTSASGTIASNGISVSIGPYLTTAMNSTSRPAFSADASSTFQTLTFQNSNGISFSNNAGAVRLTHDLKFTTQSNLSLFAVSNTTQSTSGTAASNALSFGGAGIASVGVTGGSVVISVPSGGGAGDGGVFAGVSTGGNTLGSTGTVSTGNLVFVGSNNLTLSQSTGAAGSAATITILGPTLYSGGVSNLGNTAGSTGLVSNQLVYVGSSGITLSQSTGGASSATITFAGWPYLSYARYPMDIGGASATNTEAKATRSIVMPFEVQQPISFDFLRLLLSNGTGAASTTAATTGNTQFSGGYSKTHNIVLYKRGVGANSMSLQYLTSTQNTDDIFSMNVSANANSTQFSYSMRYTFPVSNGVIGLTKDYSSSAASLNFHTSHITDLTAGKVLDIPFAYSLSPGQYWIAYGISTSTASQFTADVTRPSIIYSNVGGTVFGFNFGPITAATNNSVMGYPGMGIFATAGGGTTSSIPFANITVSNNHWFPQLQFVRIT